MGEVTVFVLGLLVGSFANATAWRVQSRRAASMATRPSSGGEAGWPGDVAERGSIWRGRSACVHCGHRLAPRDLVPVLSWLMLRGRCRYCTQAISVRYPASEVLTGTVFALTYTAI